MHRASKRRRWKTILRNLLLGALLGILQMLVLGEFLSFWPPFFPWWLSLGASALLYLLISAIAGFFAAQQRGDPNTGVGAGCLVGVVSFVVLSIINSLITSLQLHNTSPHYTSSRFPIDPTPIFLFLFEILGGAIFTVVGSSIGEAWGLKHYLARYQRQGRVEKKLS